MQQDTCCGRSKGIIKQLSCSSTTRMARETNSIQLALSNKVYLWYLAQSSLEPQEGILNRIVPFCDMCVCQEANYLKWAALTLIQTIKNPSDFRVLVSNFCELNKEALVCKPYLLPKNQELIQKLNKFQYATIGRLRRRVEVELLHTCCISCVSFS